GQGDCGPERRGTSGPDRTAAAAGPGPRRCPLQRHPEVLMPRSQLNKLARLERQAARLVSPEPTKAERLRRLTTRREEVRRREAAGTLTDHDRQWCAKFADLLQRVRARLNSPNPSGGQ